MKKALLSFLMLVSAATAFGAELLDTDERVAKYALARPTPEYPYAARARWLEGRGRFSLQVDSVSGKVTKVKVVQSTGHKILDAAALSALRRWRFRPGVFAADDRILIPVNFEMEGTEMAGQVSDPPQKARAVAIYARRPDYPLVARRSGLTGSGLFQCIVDRSTGEVNAVRVLRSTGHRILDDAASSALRQWRFKPGTVRTVTMPMAFTQAPFRPAR